MQELLILIVFIVSMAFVGRKLYMQLKTKDGCDQGCAKCSEAKPKTSNKMIRS